MTEFLIAVIAVIAVILLTERSAWQQINRLRKELSVEAIQQIQSSGSIRAAILELSQARSADAANSNKLASFKAARDRLTELLRKELARTQSSREKGLIEEISTESQAYCALILESNPHSGVVEEQYRHLLENSERLRIINEADVQKLLKTVDGQLTRLQRFLFIALAGLLICGVVILGLAYRRMVGPLRNSLAESRVLIERQEKLASLGVFATGIAHEIRNPITAIKVRLFTLKGSHAPGTDEFEDLQVIESEIDRLERIVQEFLRFARPADPDLMPIPIDTFLQEVHGILLPEITKRGIHFELNLEANETVRIDPEKMKQVMFNFIQNAADSIEGQGTVTLSSKKDRQVIGGRSLPAVTVEITDTGKGMPQEVQKRLFDPFFTTKEKGTGLGLPIAARIVEKHGGLIQYRTEPGRGTTFSILLPKASA
ncbi:MAG TPA: ATP-binding protein [Clostridia bacterium]|nr:ATP-binding protein [Clostridia bacterium]